MTQRQTILASLAEAPGTSREIGERLGMDLQLASAWLSYLWKRGEIRRELPTSNPGGTRRAFVYSLPEGQEGRRG